MTSLFPNIQALAAQTEPLKLFTPIDCIHETLIAPPCSDEIERALWRGRILDGRSVAATFAGIDELPRVIPVFHLGKLS
ncbi:MAG: hypothetical protein QMD04_10610 [Anaerolineales bacterium]|nr:hypothetical protein [Anaerolineales bacterium]